METFEGEVIEISAGEVVEQLRKLLEVYAYEAAGEIDGEQHDAQQAVEVFHDYSERLEEDRATLASLEQEYAELPNRAFKANMDGDAMLEEELRGRYAEVSEELPKVRSRVQELEAETRRLCPDSLAVWPSSGVELHQHRRAGQIAVSRSEEATKLAEQIAELVEESLEPIHRRREGLESFLRIHSDLIERARKGEHLG